MLFPLGCVQLELNSCSDVQTWYEHIELEAGAGFQVIASLVTRPI